MNDALRLLLHFFAGWVNRRQLDVIEYLKAENIVLQEQLGGRRLRLTDAQRRRLAVRGKTIGRKALMEVACIVTPDTILRWYRRLIARKYDGSKRRRPGRPCTDIPAAQVRGVNLYAKQVVDGRDRRQLERLASYVTRPPVPKERLALRDDGCIELTLKRAWRDGTRALLFEPHDLLARQILPHGHQRGELTRELTHQFLRISMAVYSALDKALKSRLSDEVYGSVPDSVAEMLGLPDPDDMMKE